jgi:hypothetical protein
MLPATAFAASQLSRITASKQGSLQQNHGNSIARELQKIIFFNNMQQ